MIKIPTLPFACSIVGGGGRHAGVHVDNDAVFNGEYLEGLHEVHGKDIPHLLTEKCCLHYIILVNVVRFLSSTHRAERPRKGVRRVR